MSNSSSSIKLNVVSFSLGASAGYKVAVSKTMGLHRNRSMTTETNGERRRIYQLRYSYFKYHWDAVAYP
jgi:hypothetical protein